MFEEHYEGDNLVIEILPGLLEARTNQGFGGQPCLIGKRTFSSNLPFAKSIYENPEEYPELHEVQRVALYAFALGREWERRGLQERMKEAFDVARKKRLEAFMEATRVRQHIVAKGLSLGKVEGEMIEVVINLVSPSTRLLHRIRIINQGTGDEEKGNYVVLMDNPSVDIIMSTTVRGIADFDRGRGALALVYEALARLLQEKEALHYD